MTNNDAIEVLEQMRAQISNDYRWLAIDRAIKALNHEVYWEDVKQALNGWLNNTTSPNTALNDIYRAYMGKGDAE